MKDREVPEAEEVELQDAELVERLVLELALDGLGFLRALERDQVGERVARDDHARRVRSRRADEPLDLLGEIEQPLHVRLDLHVAQFGDHAARLLEVDAEWDDLRDAVGLAIRHAEHARHVAHRGAREHRVERRDLRDAIGAVLLRHVGDDLIAPVVHEVDVDVRRGIALQVEEPVEDEPVLDRVDVREADRVVHQ